MGSEDFLERFDGHSGVDPCRNIGVRIGPGLGVGLAGKVGDDGAAGEARIGRILGIDGRVGAGRQRALFARHARLFNHRKIARGVAA